MQPPKPGTYMDQLDVGKKYEKIGDLEWVRDRILEAMRDGGYTQQNAEVMLDEYLGKVIVALTIKS